MTAPAGAAPAAPAAVAGAVRLRRDLVWAAAGCLVAVVVLAGLRLSPLVPLAAVVLAVLAVLVVRAPSLLVAATLGVVIVSTPLQSAVGGAASSLDDAAVLLCAVALPLRRLVLTGRLVHLPGAWWFAGFLVIGLLSGLDQHVATGTSLQGAFLAVKALLLAFAAAQVTWTRRHLDVAVKVGLVLVAVVVVTGLVNLAAPGPWAQLLGTPATTGPYGLPALTGIFSRPGAYSRFCGVLALAALAHALTVRRTPVAWGAFVACAALAFLTLQVKSLLGLLATTLVLCLPLLLRARPLLVLSAVPAVGLLLVPPVVLLVSTDVDRYVFQESARSLITEGGVRVADATFPFGAGFGQYASATAADTYSRWYYQLGFDRRFGLGPAEDSGQFLNDTQWPAVYGEAGWLGAACFAAGVVCMLVFLLRGLLRERDRRVRWVFVTALGWMLLLLVESAAAPVFVSAPSYPFVFLGVAVAAALVAQQRAQARGAAPETGLAAVPVAAVGPGSA